MGDVCANCSHFDHESTELPVCVLHRRFMNAEWTCGDFKAPPRLGEDGDENAEA